MNKFDEILTAAMRLFSEKGYHATSMRTIAKEAGIVQSSIYNHFPSKEAILKEIMRVMGEEIVKTFEFDPTLPKSEKIEQYKKKILTSLKSGRQFWRMIHSIRLNGDIVDFLQPQMNQMESMVLQNLSNLLSGGKRKIKKEEVLLLWASIDGIAASFLLINDYPLEKVLNLLFEKYKE